MMRYKGSLQAGAGVPVKAPSRMISPINTEHFEALLRDRRRWNFGGNILCYAYALQEKLMAESHVHLWPCNEY